MFFSSAGEEQWGLDVLCPQAGSTMRQHSRSNPRTLHPARWSMLFLWWVTHALVGGSVRVAFETELISITRSPRFALREADLPWLLQTGTISTVTGKLLCGPIVAWLGLRLVGLASLLLCGVILLGVAVSGPEGGPLVPLFVAWNLIRLFQVATWPATNQLLAAWFPTAEHGRAWGIMSTASRVGIICVTIAVSLRDTWQAAGDRVIKEHAGGDSSDAVQGTFFVVGVAMVLWAGVIYALLQNFPVQQIDFDGLGRDDGDEMAWNRFLQLLVATMRRPMFIFGLVAQGMATPIAEFQSQVPPSQNSFYPSLQRLDIAPCMASLDEGKAKRGASLVLTERYWQVPLLISRDKLLTPGDIGPSLTLWLARRRSS